MDLLRLSELRIGDIILSTTSDVISQAIKATTNSRFSHASVYVGTGVIVESNDDGVLPRKFSVMGHSSSGEPLGLPYENWTSVVVLRHPMYSESQWQPSIARALRDHVGLDYPPPSSLLSVGPTWVRILAQVPAKLYEAIQWLRNVEALRYEAWCSKLVGYVLCERFAHALTSKQRAVLYNATPQQLFDLSQELGFVQVPILATAAPQDAALLADMTETLLEAQSECFAAWRFLAQQNRMQVREETTVRQLLSLRKHAQFFFFLTLALLVALGGFLAWDLRRPVLEVGLPSLVDLRPAIAPSEEAPGWRIANTMLSHDQTVERKRLLGLTPTVLEVSATLEVDQSPIRFYWTYFINMHEESGNWLSIERSATPFEVERGSRVPAEVMHRATPNLPWEGLMRRIAQSTRDTGGLTILYKGEGFQASSRCTLNLRHWRDVLQQTIVVRAGQVPPSFTMCCSEHPASRQDPRCGPTLAVDEGKQK